VNLTIRDYGLNLIKLRYGERSFILEKDSNKDVREAADKLGLALEGVKQALYLFHREGIKSFNVPNIAEVSEEYAWNAIQSIYSGIDREYLYCLLSAAASPTGMVPLIVCTGPSGAGKSGTVHLAAKLLGVSVYESEYRNVPRSGIRATEIATTRNAGFCLFDEFAKFSRFDSSLLDTALLFTRTKECNLPTCVFTDVRIPDGITRIRQIQRRARFFRLTESVAWPNPSEVLIRCPAAASLVKYAIQKPWKDTTPNTEHIVKLLNAIVSAPPLKPPHSHRCIGQGWKLVNFESQDALSDAWNQISDSQIGGSRNDSMMLDEVSLSQILGIDGIVLVECRPDVVYPVLYIRIVSKVNGEIKYNEIPNQILRQ
jgi:hypothetical protein